MARAEHFPLTANPFHPVSSIMIHDVIPFEDLLRSTAKAEDEE